MPVDRDQLSQHTLSIRRNAEVLFHAYQSVGCITHRSGLPTFQCMSRASKGSQVEYH